MEYKNDSLWYKSENRVIASLLEWEKLQILVWL